MEGTSQLGCIDFPHIQTSVGLSIRSEEHTSELQSPDHLVCRLLLEKKKINSGQRRGITIIPHALNQLFHIIVTIKYMKIEKIFTRGSINATRKYSRTNSANDDRVDQ